MGNCPFLVGGPCFEPADPVVTKPVTSHTSHHGPIGKGQQKVTDFCLFGVLLPDVGLTDPEVSTSSAEDHEDKSCENKKRRRRRRRHSTIPHPRATSSPPSSRSDYLQANLIRMTRPKPCLRFLGFLGINSGPVEEHQCS